MSNIKNIQNEIEKVSSLPLSEQKKYYRNRLSEHREKDEVRTLLTFHYGRIHYQEGNFRKTIEILEPVVLDYQSYPYSSRLISCFPPLGSGFYPPSQLCMNISNPCYYFFRNSRLI